MNRWLYIGGSIAVVAMLVVGAVFLQSESDRVTAEKERLAPGYWQAPEPDRALQCQGVAGSSDERLDACLAQLSDLRLGRLALQDIAELSVGKRVLAIGPSLGVARQVGLDDELRAALMGDDEASAARLMVRRKIRVVVVPRDLTRSMDRDNVLMSRLAHHDHLEWFQLRRVTDRAMIYTARTSTMVVATRSGAELIDGLRTRLTGRVAGPQAWKPKSARLLAGLRLQGNLLAIAHTTGTDLDQGLDRLAVQLATSWRRDVAPQGHGSLEDRLADVRIEVHVVMVRARVEPRSRWALYDLWEPGVDGMMLRNALGVKDEHLAFLPGSEAVARSLPTTEEFLAFGASQYGWTGYRPWASDDVRLDLLRTEHFMEVEAGGQGGVARLVRGQQEQHVAFVDDSKARDLLIDGAEWWLRNMRADGRVTYKVWPVQRRGTRSYSFARHAMAVRDLVAAWRYRSDPRYLEGARRSMDWLERYAVRHSDRSHLGFPHPPKDALLFRYPHDEAEVPGEVPAQHLSSVAVALPGWIAWAQATNDTSRDDVIRQMATFVKSRQADNGRFHPQFVYAEHPSFHDNNDVVSSEAAVALMLVADYLDEPGWAEGVPRFFDYYRPWFRARARRLREGSVRPQGLYDTKTRRELMQFAPWAIMACEQRYRRSGDDDAADFGLEIAQWMVENYQWTSENAPFPDYVGGYYKVESEVPGVQSVRFAEGAAAAYRIALGRDPSKKAMFERSARESLRFLGSLVHQPANDWFVADPAQVKGGPRYSLVQQQVRVDHVSHGMSFVSQYLDARAEDPEVTNTVQVIAVPAEPAHVAIWGNWRIHPEKLPDLGRELADEQRASMLEQAARLSRDVVFSYTPDTYLRVGEGTAVQMPYTVIGTADDHLLVEVHGLGETRARQLRVDGDTLEVVGEGMTQYFVRSVDGPVLAAPRSRALADREEGGPRDFSGE